MAKKKKPSLGNFHGFGAKGLIPELQKAEALLVRNKLPEAKEVLERLNQTYPQNKDVLSFLVNVCYDLQDSIGYTHACEQLLQADPKNADVAYGLAGGYMITMHPLLALRTFRYALGRFPNHERAESSRSSVDKLEGYMAQTLLDLGLSGEEGKDIATLHEMGQVHLERGDYLQARQVANEVLQLKPDFISAQNNLSLISYSEGNVEDAIAISQGVLEIEPENIHALSNLVRFHYLSGQIQAAQTYGDRLKSSEAKAWDRWTKKVEGLSYLGDDAGVLKIYEQAKAEDDLDNNSALFYHLVAVAMQRSGQPKPAQKLWKQALERSPSDELAQGNLNDLKQPLSERHGPWAFDLQTWMMPQDATDFRNIMPSITATKSDKQIQKGIQTYLNTHPNFVHIISVLLERGNPQGRMLAFSFAAMADTPELLEALRRFALGQYGPDSLRTRAAQKLAEAGLFPPGETTKMWMQGEWHDILLLGFEFHEEPQYQHPPKVQNLLTKAIELLHRQEVKSAKEAEQILQQALEMEPEAPDILNNIAVAYQSQGRIEESETLIQQIHQQYPDYLMARVSVARRHLLQDDVDAAEALLKPLLSRKRFHYAEFAQFSSAYIDLLMAQKNPKAAQTWLNLWESVDPEHPAIKRAKMRLSSPGLLEKMSKLRKGRISKK